MAKKPLAENELYKAAPLLQVLEGDDYHPEENVLKMIEEVAKLREAVVYSSKGSLKFVGEIDGEELTIDVNMTDLKKSCRVDQHVFVKATVGDQVQTLDSNTCTLHCGFKHYMDIVKCMGPFKKGHDIPEGTDLPLEFWADTEEGKKFFEELSGLGFRVNRDDRYFYDSPCNNTNVHALLPMLEYSQNIDHFYNTFRGRDINMRAKTEHTTALFYFDSCSPFLKYAKDHNIAYQKELVAEWDYDHPKHPYGVKPDVFLDFVKKVIKHNTERLDAISEQHGGLTWRGIEFGDGLNKFEKPRGYKQLPEAERKRIDAAVEATKAKVADAYDEFFSKSPFSTVYKFFKEHGTVNKTHGWQYGECHDISFKCNVTLEVPKKDRTLTKKTVEIYGAIQGYYKDELGGEHGDEIKINLPFHYATDKGRFPSWAEAIKAGSNIRYGGSLNVGTNRCTYELQEGDHYGHWACKLRASDLKKIEDVILNIEKDNQQFLKDCHYKD
jgi:hypothetical protein